MKFYYLALCASALFLSGCGTPSAPDFPKSWRPLNELPDKPIEISLSRSHVYRVMQVDTTVKGLLDRWAEEAKMPLVYNHGSDFSLYKNVQSIKSNDLNEALSELTSLYQEQGMVFYIENNVLMAHQRLENSMQNNTKNRTRNTRLRATKK